MIQALFPKSAVLAFALVVGVAGCASKQKAPDPTDSVSGVIMAPAHTKLSPAAVAYVRLADVSRGHVMSETVVQEKVTVAEDGTIPFTLVFKEKQIDPRHKYAVDARIVDKNRVIVIGGKHYPVLTKGNPDTVEMEVASAY